MTLLTSQRLASLIGMTRKGLNKMVKRFPIPHQRIKNRFIFDLNTPSPFFESVRLSMDSDRLKPFYTRSQLAQMMYRHKDTISKILKANQIPIYRNGSRIIIMLVDLQRLRDQIDSQQLKTR